MSARVRLVLRVAAIGNAFACGPAEPIPLADPKAARYGELLCRTEVECDPGNECYWSSVARFPECEACVVDPAGIRDCKDYLRYRECWEFGPAYDAICYGAVTCPESIHDNCIGWITDRFDTAAD